MPPQPCLTVGWPAQPATDDRLPGPLARPHPMTLKPAPASGPVERGRMPS